MVARFETAFKLYGAANVERILVIVQEYWARNPEGNLHLDWIDIVKEKQWQLSLL